MIKSKRPNPNQRLRASARRAVPAVGDAESADERAKGQPLADEGDEDDGEREEDHQATAWKRIARIGLQRKGQGRGQGDGAAHATPAQDQRQAG